MKDSDTNAHATSTVSCPRCGELERALEEFEAATRALPEGHEDRTKGACSYNWRMACLRELRARAARTGKDGGPVMCEECGIYPADQPSKLCPGCEAYREHQT
jgi:hypothetical protein